MTFLSQVTIPGQRLVDQRLHQLFGARPLGLLGRREDLVEQADFLCFRRGRGWRGGLCLFTGTHE